MKSGLTRGSCALVVLLVASALTPAAEVAATNAPAPAALTTQQDHQRMLKLLGITAIRRGRDGMNPQSPYYPHYHEAKANPEVGPLILTGAGEKAFVAGIIALSGRGKQLGDNNRLSNR